MVCQNCPRYAAAPALKPIQEIEVPVLIIGGGPAGLSAGIELGKRGVKALIVDDKHRLGGKLVLQTHRFFGSTNMVYAGTRGIDIATKLEKEVRQYPSLEIWLHSTALAVFSDRQDWHSERTGMNTCWSNRKRCWWQPERVKTSWRSKATPCRAYMAPAPFRPWSTAISIRPAEKLFIVGGGNVGLIAGYHALQAGIGVVGLVEALPECGGYKVHKDKLVRMGVPIYTAHTILSANGADKVESVTIAAGRRYISKPSRAPNSPSHAMPS